MEAAYAALEAEEAAAAEATAAMEAAAATLRGAGAVALPALQLVDRLLQNVLGKPDEAKYRRIRLANAKIDGHSARSPRRAGFSSCAALPPRPTESISTWPTPLRTIARGSSSRERSSSVRGRRWRSIRSTISISAGSAALLVAGRCLQGSTQTSTPASPSRERRRQHLVPGSPRGCVFAWMA